MAMIISADIIANDVDLCFHWRFMWPGSVLPCMAACRRSWTLHSFNITASNYLDSLIG